MKKIKIITNCQWVGTEQVHIIEVEDDISDDTLDSMAYEMALEDHTPEGSWEEADVDEELTE